MGLKEPSRPARLPEHLCTLVHSFVYPTKSEPAVCSAGAGAWRRGLRQDANPGRPHVFWGEKPQVFKE